MWTKEKIHELLDSNPMAVMKALVVIYDRQTETEKEAKSTRQANGIGVPTLSPRQLAIATNKMKRYHRQLCELANSKAGAK